jgi:CheY-like chemotaxis protein
MTASTVLAAGVSGSGGASSPTAGSPSTPSAGRTAKRVLVVDDNEDAAVLIAASLEVDGYSVRLASDGQMALEVASEHVPEVAILDIGLPLIDGYELARRFRATPELAGMCLIALTGYGQPSDRRRAMDAGFDHHLVKPVTIAALRAILDAL